MNDIHYISTFYLLSINFIAIAAYGWDKFCAKQHMRRTPEKILLLLAVIGGSVGAMAGMWLFRHKTLHLKFRFGLPLIFILQIAALIWLHVRTAF